jgi:hypothetical protein
VARADRIARRDERRAARAARRYVPPQGIPGLPQLSWQPGLGDPWSGPAANMPAGVGDSMLGFIYSALGYGMSGLGQAPNNTGVTNVAGLFDGGGAGLGGGTDWGSIIGGIGSQIAGIYSTKAQNKQLRRLMKLGLGGARAPIYNAIPQTGGGYLASGFSGVPAVSTGGFAGGLGAAAAGALGGLGLGLLPELGDMLPGGLEEAGTGLFGPDLFKVGAASQRQRMIDAVHPTSGERVYWRPVGRPIMFTGDAALLKRSRKMVRKLSSSAGCGFGGRTFRRRRR